MKKRILSLLLLFSMLLPLLPTMALPVVAATEETVSRFRDDIVVSTMATPKTYGAYLSENGLTDSQASKNAYKAYYMENSKVTWSGNWSAGQTRYTGEYAPFSNEWAFNKTTYWTDEFKSAGWYATKANVESALSEYVSREAYNYIWRRDDFALTSDPGFNTAQTSYEYTGYYTYSYTVPKDGQASPVILANDTMVKENARMLIMHNDKVVWPSGALLANTTTWETGHSEGTTLLAATHGISLNCKEGDQIRFVITGAQGSINRLNVQVSLSSEPLPEELFELQASSTLSSAFSASFIATYQNQDAADAAEATFSVAGNAVTPEITDISKKNGAVVRNYTIRGLAARELTETIDYRISCAAMGESKTEEGSITIAELISYHFAMDGGLVDITDTTASLAMNSLNYAATAQSYFGHNTEKLANTAVPSAQRIPSLKVSDRTLPDSVYHTKEGANLHIKYASLILGETVSLKFTIDADTPVDDLSVLKLRVMADGYALDNVAAFEYRENNTDNTRIKCIVDIPMFYYGEQMTFSVYKGNTLVSDTLEYSVATYAKRMYGKDPVLDSVLDAILALGDAGDVYHERVENVVRAQGKAIPAMSGEVIDLGEYYVDFGGKLLAGTEVSWKSATSQLRRVIDERYLLAPNEAGEYPLLVEYEGEFLVVTLSVRTVNSTHNVPTLDKIQTAVFDISSVGFKGAASDTWRKDLNYWRWALNLAAYRAKKNDAKRDLPTFLFATDMHWEYNNRNFAEVANYLAAELKIDTLLFGGDYMNGSDTYSDSIKVAEGWLKEMSTFDGYWYAVRGNHDTNSTKPIGPDDLWPDSELNDLYSKSENFGGCADRSAEGITVVRKVTAAMGVKDKKGNLLTQETDDCLFYYMDDANQKIRYYFLDDGGGGYFGNGGGDVTQEDDINVIPYAEQMKWLKYTATQGDDPLTEGWGIVAMTHRGFNPNQKNGVEDPTHYTGLLTAALNEVEKEISGVDVFCILSGHTHWDGQLYNEEGGYYIVSTSSDADTRSGTQVYLPELDTEVQRSAKAEPNTNSRVRGTDTEQLFDIVQIDRENRKVYFTRVGDGYSRTFDY